MVVPNWIALLVLASFIVAPEPARDSPSKLGTSNGPAKIRAAKVH